MLKAILICKLFTVLNAWECTVIQQYIFKRKNYIRYKTIKTHFSEIHAFDPQVG